MKLTHFRDTSQDPTVAPRLQQQAADMFDPLLSPCLVQLQCAGDGAKTLGSMVIIDDTSDLDPTTVDEKLPQGVFPVSRFHLPRVADVDDSGQAAAAAANRRSKQVSQLVRKRRLVGLRNASQIDRAEFLAAGDDAHAGDSGHLEKTPRSEPESDAIPTDRKDWIASFRSSLLDQLHQFANLGILAKRFHRIGQRSNEPAEFPGSDPLPHLVFNHLERAALSAAGRGKRFADS